MIRRIRSILSGGHWPQKAPYNAEAHLAEFDQAWWLIRLYYGATLYVAYRIMGRVWATSSGGGVSNPLWPVAWARDLDLAGPVLIVFMMASAVLGVLVPKYLWVRISVFVSFFLANAYWLSSGQGSVNHGSHFWIWLGLVFCFLPSGSKEEIGSKLRSRHQFLLVYWAGMALILLFYSMSGFWKVAGAIEAMMVGRTSAFEPTALAIIAAWTMILDGEPTILGPLITTYPWIGWPAHIGVIYVELVAFLIAFRPALHRLWGVLLVGFHICTFLLLGINFPQHMFVLIIILIWSPFPTQHYSMGETLRQLPGLGWMFPRPVRQAQQPVGGVRGL